MCPEMRELPRSSVVKFVPRKLIPDGNSKKPPISCGNGVVVQQEKTTSVANVTAVSVSNENISSAGVRESIVSDISSSRPNSTASERSLSTEDDDDDDSATECSESEADGSTDEDGGIGENRVPLEPISEETSLRKKSDEDDGLIFLYIYFFYVNL